MLRLKTILCGILFLLATALVQAQCTWLDLTDETSTRLSLTTVPTTDGEEKDVAIADFDKDGWTDVVVVRKTPFSNPGAQADLLLMNLNGVLTDMTSTLAPEFISSPTDSRDVHVTDVNVDGWMDLFIITTFENQPQLYINLGEDTNGDWLGFDNQSSTRFPTVSVSPLQFCAGWAGDVTGNGSPDIYLINYNPGGLSEDVLLINDGTGVFTDESNTRLGNLRNCRFGTGVEIYDMDNDGDLDIIKNNSDVGGTVAPFSGTGVYVLFNDGTGNFTDYDDPSSPASYMFTVGDLDNDGKKDIYVVDDNQDYVHFPGAIQPDTTMNYSTSTISFSPRTTGFGGNCKLYDFDGDGDLDIGVASVDVDIPPCETTGNRKFTILRNAGVHSGNLSSVYGTSNEVWNLANHDFDMLDIDNDGRLDLFMAVCTGYKIFMQGHPLSPSATTTDDSGSGDGAIDLSVSGGAGPYTYAWSNGATTQDLSGLAAGTYSVFIQDDNGCTDQLVVEVGSSAICTNPATGLSSSFSASNLTLSWNSLAADGVLGYRIQGRVLGSASIRTLPPVVIEPSTSVSFPISVLTSGESYEWRVVGGCALDGSVLTPFSAWAGFTAPAGRFSGGFAETDLQVQSPATDVVRFNLSFEASANAQAAIYDLLGREIAAPVSIGPAGLQGYSLDLPTAVESGIYILRVVDGNVSVSSEFVVVQ